MIEAVPVPSGDTPTLGACGGTAAAGGAVANVSAEVIRTTSARNGLIRRMVASCPCHGGSTVRTGTTDVISSHYAIPAPGRTPGPDRHRVQWRTRSGERVDARMT